MIGNESRFASISTDNTGIQSVYDKYLEPAPTSLATVAKTDLFAKDYLTIGLEKDEKLKSLWNGERPRQNESKDDMALLSKLAYWCNGVENDIITAFMNSPYYKQKTQQQVVKCCREDYLPRTIQKVLDKLTSTALEDDKKESSKPNVKKPFTIEALDNFLLSSGIALKFNEITHEAEIEGVSSEYSGEQLEDIFSTLIFDKLNGKYIKCTMGNIQNFLNAIYAKNRYNPIVDMLNSVVWDKKSRLPEVYAILGIRNDFSQLLVKKWLMQCVSMLFNSISKPYGADGVLVLVGKQGIGKTSFFRALSCGFFKEGAYIDYRDKDTLRRATSCWICELGEIESTLRRDIEKTKALITMERDSYRLPYGRADIKYLRRTSFCGTCNSSEFLIDPTGNRRFWTVPVDIIDLALLGKFNVHQLWAEVYELVKNEGFQAFRLIKDEQDILNERNIEHQKPIKAQREVEDILSRTLDNPQYEIKSTTISSWKERFSELGRYNSSEIGRALSQLGYNKSELKSVDGKKGRFHDLPVYKETEQNRQEHCKHKSMLPQ